MSFKLDYEYIADALSQAIKAYNCCYEEVTDGCRYGLLSSLEMSIYSLQKSLSVLLDSYGNWPVFLGLSKSTVARYQYYLLFEPCSIREFREACCLINNVY